MKKIVFFIENSSYIKYSLSLLKMFNNHSVTVYSFDELHIENLPTYDFKTIKSKSDFIVLFSKLECDFLFTTTPGVGTSYFPKSKIYPKNNRPKYVYYFHSLVSPNESYIKNSFKGFDYILSPSIIISNQLKILAKNSQIIDFGYQLFDGLEFNYSNLPGDTKKVLIAPTWHEDSLFNYANRLKLQSLVDFFENYKYKVFLRPHFMELKDLTTNYDDEYFLIDEYIDLQNFDFLVTDWSGISLEYFFTTGRVTLFIDTKKKIRRTASLYENKSKLIENYIIGKIGPKISISELSIQTLKNFKIEKDDFIESIFKPSFDFKTNKEKILNLIESNI